ncbi:acyl-CoA thioester hydrolase [Luteitalea sp. TBR-22]|uniref:acyl-CoA thioesterase n=1 Tax=Luteitalea sp. TBR-22 TaxID=2802971 RepID=UPI001AF4AB6B|nr:thioesterase family protein [Luteitalea sp. TBR-22]BCS33628.1 acyl-CoA thioester hydrolase [Luteitalea sp. TBR-22]
MSRVAGAARIRVRYAETDQMGVVYHGNYFAWFEVGRVELLRQLGWSYKALEADGVSLPVIEATCTYLHPARYDDELEIRTTGRMASALRVEFTYELVRLEDARVLATARTMHVPVNRDGRPCRLPVALREIFS